MGKSQRWQIRRDIITGSKVNKFGSTKGRESVLFPYDANAAKMEQLLEDGINAIGLGPQGMGGNYSVMGVNIENTARHPSAIGVAVNVGCWSHRRGHIVFDKDLNYTVDTHTGFVYEEK